jgi:2-haloacid dehalogenase
MATDAIVFDAYGTLFDVYSVGQRCESCFPGQGKALALAWRAKQLEYTWLRSLMRRYRPFSDVTRDALAHACEALGLKLAVAQMEALMSEYLSLSVYPDVPAALEHLKRFRLSVLTNGSPDMIEPLIQHSGLRFEAVLSVDELKVFKPAPPVYELVTTRLLLPPANICFVSSNCWDALGAKSFGFTTFWINRGGAPLDRLGFRPDGVLKSLGELPDVLL